MIGQTLDWLKNPKNVVPWLITGYVMALGGYILMHKLEVAGRIIGFFGALAILVTLLRVSLTRPLVGIVLLAAVIAYGWWYGKSVSTVEVSDTAVYEHEPWKQYVSTRKRPKYAESGMSQRTQEAIFAPAFMFENVFRRGQWRSVTLEQNNPNYVAPHN